MSRQSIRVRLTTWYLLVMTLAIAAAAGGSWWLLRRSLYGAADESLRTRIEGVRTFITSVERQLPREEVRDEFREYADLTQGESLVEVTDATGAILCRPTVPAWDAIRRGEGAGGRAFRVATAEVVVAGQTFHVAAAISMGPAEDALARVRSLIVLLLPAVLLLAGAGGYWISGRALAPVDRMTRAAQAITLRHLDRRIDVPEVDDELRRLAVTFNDMLARLQASVADMARLTAEASHELRTPVSLVRATAEVALARERPADEYRQALGEVLEHAERLSRLVGDLLALARADAGVEPRETTTVDLRDLASEAARDVQVAAAGKGLTLAVELPQAAVEITVDAESVRRLLLVLLDNALKYTPAGGAVRLVVSARPAPPRPGDALGSAVVEVIDSGSGIDPVDLPRVFDRFYRGAAARELVTDGSGLGLSIARTIVERAGGAIVLDAGPGGRGCRAEVRLPLTTVRDAGPDA